MKKGMAYKTVIIILILLLIFFLVLGALYTMVFKNVLPQ